MLALVVCKNPDSALGIVRSLGAMGARADVMSSRRTTAARFSRYCHHFARLAARALDVSSQDAADRINEYCASHGVDLVIAGDAAATMLLAQIQEGLMSPVFPVADPALLRTLQDEWLLADLLGSLGLPAARTRGLAAAPAPGAASKLALNLLANHGGVVAWTLEVDGEPAVLVGGADSEGALSLGERLVAATGYHGVMRLQMRGGEREAPPLVERCTPGFWETVVLSTWRGVNFVAIGAALALGQPRPRAAAIRGVVDPLPELIGKPAERLRDSVKLRLAPLASMLTRRRTTRSRP